MPSIYWSDEAHAFFEALPPEVQQAVERRLHHLRRFPEMYSAVQTGHFRGYRRIPILRRYTVIYRLFGEDQHVFIRAIVHARAQPR
jgi:mRNA-degrading endonuclease RelE of RelBE toxin-antitoxin system